MTINPAFYLTTYLFIPVLFGTGDGKASYDDTLKKIVFNADTLGYRHYLTVISYDLYGAAAEIWSQKASARSNYINLKTDNHTLALEQEYQHCLERYKYYIQKSFKLSNSKFTRKDQGVGFGIYRRDRHVLEGRYPLGDY
jgi:GH18 family chitinase